jgi:SAM-dependent methyltransferase
MRGDAASFVGNIPERYDSGLGPMVFVDYAADIARRAAACSPARVLETAAGTGIVTRQLRDVLPPSAHVTATDLNAPMLEVARTKFRPGEAVDFQAADATALPFPDGAFDERNFSRLRRTFTGLSPLCVCYFLLFCSDGSRSARFSAVHNTSQPQTTREHMER